MSLFELAFAHGYEDGRLSEDGFVDGVSFVLLPDADDEDLGVETPVWEAFVLLRSSLTLDCRFTRRLSTGGYFLLWRGPAGARACCELEVIGVFSMQCLVVFAVVCNALLLRLRSVEM